MEVAHEVLGGGRIQFEPEKKTMASTGHSMGFPAGRASTATTVREGPGARIPTSR